jgi:hypothetical protein
MKKSNRINILPGNYLVLYTNTFTDILFYITSLGTKFVNFVPFALLFKHSFIFLDAKALKIFLITVNKVNNLTLFFNLFTIYKLTYDDIFVNIFSMFRSIIFRERSLEKIQ